jgi:hypothetical protein
MQIRRVIVFILLSLNIFVGLFVRSEPESKPYPPFAMGAHLLMTGVHTEFPRAVWGEHLRYVREMTGAGGWVAQVVQSTDRDITKWQAFLDDCFALGLRPVLRLATYPHPKTGHWVIPTKHDPQAWESFFADLHLSEPVWVIIGNEPNSGGEWGGRANATAYANYFVKVASRLKKLDQPLYIAMAALDLYAPHTNDLPFPGLDMTFMDAPSFIDGVLAAEPRLMDYVDFWASHSYPMGPFTEPPNQQVYQFDRINGAENLLLIHPPDGIYNRGINGYRWEMWYLEYVHNTPMPPILISEFGYRHRESVDPTAHDKPAREVDTVTIGGYLEAAIWGIQTSPPNPLSAAERGSKRENWTPLAHDSKIIGVVYFALAGHPPLWGHSGLLMVDRAGRVLGTYPHYDVLVSHE